jgi:peroxiredoxin
MIHIYAFLLLTWFLPAPEGEAIRSGCSSDDRQLGSVGVEDQVDVKQALAGGSETCYKVTVKRAGQDQSVSGYLLGEKNPAIVAFVHRRQEVGAATLAAQARLLALPPAQPKAAATDKNQPVPENLPVFESFSGRDTNGRAVSLQGMRGRVNLVAFWSPQSAASFQQVMSVLTVSKHFSRSDVSAVGISTDTNPEHIQAAFDDIGPGWSIIGDYRGLAKHYNVDSRTGMTFVLDASHHIVASGITGAALESKIRELLAAH